MSKQGYYMGSLTQRETGWETARHKIPQPGKAGLQRQQPGAPSKQVLGQQQGRKSPNKINLIKNRLPATSLSHLAAGGTKQKPDSIQWYQLPSASVLQLSASPLTCSPAEILQNWKGSTSFLPAEGPGRQTGVSSVTTEC